MKPARLGVLLLLAPGALAAQERADYATYGSDAVDVVSVSASTAYEAGPLHQLLFGRRYRDLWAAPVQVPVLDLERFAGGLTPDERGGGQQTRSLHMKSGDGREFTFRSLDKDPTKAVPEQFRGTVVHRLVQDATSAMQPGGALVAPVLLEAAGVPHAAPMLVVMPDHERLGEHRGEFAGLLGMIEERPGDGFADAADVEDSEEVFARLRESAAHRVDARAFLAARLIDHLLGDWDRHADQWRWAGTPRDDGMLWRPIPRDRDQALARYDGVVTSLVRKRNPKLTTFGPRYPSNLVGFTWNARALDRTLLAGLDRAAFDTVALAVQAALTDSVIAAAVDRLPAAYRERRGAWTEEALRARRDALPAQAARFYEYLATDVDVWATDEADRAAGRWEGDTLRLEVRSEGAERPYFTRRFVAGETDEVRLHLREGADRVVLSGRGRGPALHVVREAGDSVAWTGSLPVTLHEHLPEPEQEKDEAQEESADPGATRDWGSSVSAGPEAGYDADLGILLGGRATATDYAFRHTPYRASGRLSAVYAVGAGGLDLRFEGERRRTDPRTRLHLLVAASETEVVRFSGLGNETRDVGEAAEVAAWRVTLAPSIERDLGSALTLHAGPVLRYTTTDRDPGTVAAGSSARGLHGFGRVGAGGDLRLTRTRLSGHAGVRVYPALWDARGTYGELDAVLRGSAPLGAVTLAGRLGARRLWGPFPYDEAAFLGGARTLRGYRYQRFAGDAMLFGGVELRVPVARILPRLVPTRVIAVALGDAGRVWAAGTRSERVHAAGGGGLRLEFFGSGYGVELLHASGREGGRWYLSLGAGS